MTLATKRRLEKELDRAGEDMKNSQLAIGEAAGSESDWHDNAAFDHAQMKFDVDSARVRDLKIKLHQVEIITPRLDTTEVDIGNTVIVKFNSIGTKEKFTILGPDDSGTEKGWVSFKTPLAQSLLGKKKGEVGIFLVADNKQEVEIIDILPGEFDE
jgi:transcription elongation factor GreA